MSNSSGSDGPSPGDEPSGGRLSIDTGGLAPAKPLDDATVDRDERFLDAHDDQKLFLQSWLPADASPHRGIVALMHGYGEHSSRYQHVAGALVHAGFGVIAVDARGHGRSTGKRGHIDAFDDYVRDFDATVAHATRRWPELPVFALGHSNGGLIVLHHALAFPESIAGYAVTSPFLGFAVDVKPTKAAFGHVMSRVWPSFSVPNDVDPSVLSHDERVVEKYRRDPLVLRTTTGRWYTETRRAQKRLLERAGEIERPCLFLVAGTDELADPASSEEVFDRLGAKHREMDVFPNLRHELLNEPSWSDHIERIADWLTRHHSADSPEEAA